AGPGSAALRSGDPGTGHTGLPRLWRTAADPRMGIDDRRGPQLHRHRLVVDCPSRAGGGRGGAGHQPPQRRIAAEAGRMSRQREGMTAQLTEEGATAQLTERSTVPVLQVDDLSVAYTSGHRTRQVTHEVSLSIGSGDVVALVGESGSGKTTTA